VAVRQCVELENEVRLLVTQRVDVMMNLKMRRNVHGKEWLELQAQMTKFLPEQKKAVKSCLALKVTEHMQSRVEVQLGAQFLHRIWVVNEITTTTPSLPSDVPRKNYDMWDRNYRHRPFMCFQTDDDEIQAKMVSLNKSAVLAGIMSVVDVLTNLDNDAKMQEIVNGHTKGYTKGLDSIFVANEENMIAFRDQTIESLPALLAEATDAQTVARAKELKEMGKVAAESNASRKSRRIVEKKFSAPRTADQIVSNVVPRLGFELACFMSEALSRGWSNIKLTDYALSTVFMASIHNYWVKESISWADADQVLPFSKLSDENKARDFPTAIAVLAMFTGLLQAHKQRAEAEENEAKEKGRKALENELQRMAHEKAAFGDDSDSQLPSPANAERGGDRIGSAGSSRSSRSRPSSGTTSRPGSGRKSISFRI
jgi:hypothetical protein